MAPGRALFPLLCCAFACAAPDSVPLVQVQVAIRSTRVQVPKAARPALRVLIFCPVGAKSNTRELVQANMRHVRSFEKNESAPFAASFDLFLAHYDSSGRSRWKWVLPEWYAENVRFSNQSTGIKFFLAKELMARRSDLDPSSYTWIWFLDEDADISRMDLGRYFQAAESSGALVVSPAIVFPEVRHNKPNAGIWRNRSSASMQLFGSDADVLEYETAGCSEHTPKCRFQAPHRQCRYRYVSFVELSFPMMRPKSWAALMATEHAVNQESGWGLDNVWCALLPKLLGGHNMRENSCAIVDATPIVHKDFRTLGKYKEGSSDTQTNHKVFGLVRREWFHSEFDAEMKTWKCVV